MNAYLIDPARSVCLCGVGGGDYLLATAVAHDGTTVLVLAHEPDIGNPDVGVDPSCPEAVYDQAGPLPREVLDDIGDAVAHYLRKRQRGHRCGRRTKSGTVCRMRVARPGDACEWHREGART